MHEKIIISQHNLCVLNFSDIYKKRFLNNFHNNFMEYKIKNINIKNKDVRKLISHNVIYSICEEILNKQVNEKIVIYFSTTTIPHTFINEFINEEEILQYLEKLLLRIRKIIPVNIYISSNSFDYFVFLINKQKAEGIDILYNMISLLETNKNQKFTFEKIKSFSKKFGLTFLSNVYFNDIKSKQLLIKQ